MHGHVVTVWLFVYILPSSTVTPERHSTPAYAMGRDEVRVMRMDGVLPLNLDLDLDLDLS